MDKLEKNLKIYAKMLIFGGGLVAAKLYSEIRYYQGRIDARTDMNKKMEEIIKKLKENRKERDGEA